MEHDELKKMKDSVENAARDVEKSIHAETSSLSQEWANATSGLDGAPMTPATDYSSTVTPVYRHPKKNWRLKRGATPQWYKSRNGVRTKSLSGAARVARYRPHKP